MEFNYSISDPLATAIIALGFAVLLIFIKELTLYIRKIIPCSVTCWFCHHKTTVNYESANSWVCAECEQYNGFKKDGDYNKHIRSQHSLKNKAIVYAQQSPTYSWQAYPKLCEECNLKQEIKVQQLSLFEPMSEKNYEKEVEHFQRQLEKGFQLCGDCELLVNKVLQNLREELSLPKRLTAAMSKINIRGERAIYINIVLSVLFALSSFKPVINVPPEIQDLLLNERLFEYWDLFLNQTLVTVVLDYSLQILIGAGVLVNTIGYYQTVSSLPFLNIISWVLMFFLTLYPVGFEEHVNILKISSSIVVITVSILILMGNHERRHRKKLSSWEKTKAMKHSSVMLSSALSSSLPVPTASSSPVNDSNLKINTVNSDDSTGSINSSLSNLSIGIKSRKSLKRPNSRPVITPPKFNPFNKSPSERSYQIYGKPGTCTYSHYEPSFTPPPLYDGLEPPEQITTIPSYNYQQPYYSCSPTLAYYFTPQQYPKILPYTERFRPTSTNVPEKENSFFWMTLQSVPTIVLLIGNFVILYTIFRTPKDVLKT